MEELWTLTNRSNLQIPQVFLLKFSYQITGAHLLPKLLTLHQEPNISIHNKKHQN